MSARSKTGRRRRPVVLHADAAAEGAWEDILQGLKALTQMQAQATEPHEARHAVVIHPAPDDLKVGREADDDKQENAVMGIASSLSLNGYLLTHVSIQRNAQSNLKNLQYEWCL